MPLPGVVLTSSDNFTAGQKYTRFSGPVLVGQFNDNALTGPSYSPGGVLVIQSSGAVSTAATNVFTNQVVSTAAAAIPKAAFVYISQTTGPVSTSSFASGDSAPAYLSGGAALVWDAGRAKIGVYSTASGSGVWLWSSGAFTSS